MSDIVLVQPKLGNYGRWVKNHVPLPLLSICRYPSRQYRIKIIDQRVDKNWKYLLKKELRKQPLLVGTTSMTGSQIKHALEISKFVKQNSDTLVVWGGTHASLLPEQTLINDNIDITLKGEGERTFYELVKTLDDKKNLKNIKGISYKEKSKDKIKIINNKERPLVNLNKLPELPYNIFTKEKLKKYFSNGTVLETSRGCPFNCYYCTCSLSNSSWRAYNEEKVLDSIKLVVDKYNIKNISFIDDNLFVDLKRVKGICQSIIKNKLGVKWSTMGAHINFISKADKGCMELLYKSGCRALGIAVESGSLRILKLINKNIDIKKVIQYNKFMSRFNIVPEYDFMCGFPGETLKDLKMTIGLIFRLQKDNKKARSSPIHCYAPYPGTVLFDRIVKQGFKPPQSLEAWADVDWTKPNLMWLPKQNRDFLKRLYFASLFTSPEVRSLSKSNFINYLIYLYRPIANYRLKNLNFKFMPEFVIKEKLFG